MTAQTDLPGWPWLHPVLINALHDTRDPDRPAVILAATCIPCRWRRPVGPDHPGTDLARLQFEHSGYRQCQARDCLTWIVDAVVDGSGKRTPVDVGCHHKGNLALRFSLEEPGAWRARYLKDGEKPGDGEVRAMSHFATCPHPDQFRRRPAVASPA